MNNIFYYSDYRPFLKDFFETEKEQILAYPYSYLRMKLKLNLDEMVKTLNKEAHFTKLLITKILRVIKLEETEKDFFLLLVAFNKSKEYNDILETSNKLTRFHDEHFAVAKENKYEFLKKWHYGAVFEVISQNLIPREYLKPIKKLIENISDDEIIDAMEVLMKLDMIDLNKYKTFEIIDASITGGEKWFDEIAKQYIDKMMKFKSKIPYNVTISKDNTEIQMDEIIQKFNVLKSKSEKNAKGGKDVNLEENGENK